MTCYFPYHFNKDVLTGSISDYRCLTFYFKVDICFEYSNCRFIRLIVYVGVTHDV